MELISTIQINVDVVDIDPAVTKIAKDWFGFNEDDSLKVHVADGIQYIQSLVKSGMYLNILLVYR